MTDHTIEEEVQEKDLPPQIDPNAIMATKGTIGWAIEMMKGRRAVRRPFWGPFLSHASLGFKAGACAGDPLGQRVHPYIVMYDAQGKAHWSIPLTTNDLLATDWEEYTEEESER